MSVSRLSIYANGSSSYGELGFYSATPVHNVDLSETIDGLVENVGLIRCGGQFTYMLTKDNRLFCSGKSDMGQCASMNSQKNFREVDHPAFASPRRISHVECGENFVVICVDNFELYMCGVTFAGDHSQSFIRLVTPGLDPTLDKITSIVCSTFHVLVVVNQRDVYSVGCNQYGNCGQGKIGGIASFAPVIIKGLEGRPRVLRAVCSSLLSFLLFENGELFTCYNPYLEPKITTVFEKVVLPFVEPVKDLIHCSLGSHMILQTDSDLYVSGSNTHGQLTLGHAAPVIGFVKLNIPALLGGYEPYKFHLLRGRTYIVTRNTIKAVGYNKHGELGIYDTTRNYQLRNLSINLSYQQVVSIEGGYDYTFIICEKTAAYWFMNRMFGHTVHGKFSDLEIIA